MVKYKRSIFFAELCGHAKGRKDGTGSFVPFTGSSAAAAITAGAAALLMEWDARRFPENYLTTYTTKIYLIRGTDRREDLLYPNREWGYGTLDLYQTFLSLMTS